MSGEDTLGIADSRDANFGQRDAYQKPSASGGGVFAASSGSGKHTLQQHSISGSLPATGYRRGPSIQQPQQSGIGGGAELGTTGGAVVSRGAGWGASRSRADDPPRSKASDLNLDEFLAVSSAAEMRKLSINRSGRL